MAMKEKYSTSENYFGDDDEVGRVYMPLLQKPRGKRVNGNQESVISVAALKHDESSLPQPLRSTESD